MSPLVPRFKIIWKDRRKQPFSYSITIWFECVTVLLLVLKDDLGIFWRLVLWISHGQ